MKILLDECVVKKFKSDLVGHSVLSVTEAGFSGLKNGVLLAKAVESGFDMLLTIDKNIQYQQNTHDFAIIIVILDARSSKLEELRRLLPQLQLQLPFMEKRNAYRIEM